MTSEIDARPSGAGGPARLLPSVVTLLSSGLRAVSGMRVGRSVSTASPELIPMDPNSGVAVANTDGGGDGGIGGGANL